jgi:hypothetical protein
MWMAINQGHKSTTSWNDSTPTPPIPSPTALMMQGHGTDIKHIKGVISLFGSPSDKIGGSVIRTIKPPMK